MILYSHHPYEVYTCGFFYTYVDLFFFKVFLMTCIITNSWVTLKVTISINKYLELVTTKSSGSAGKIYIIVQHYRIYCGTNTT